MRNDLRLENAAAMLVFASVVDAGGFTEAARRLGLSKATVSRQIAALESRLGAQLLRRTTRRMSLTAIGSAFHARCQRVALEAQAAERAVAEMQTELRGEVRVAAPLSFGHRELAPRLPAFLAQHPSLRLHLDLTDRRVDLVREKFDLSIRVGASLSDSSFVQRRLCKLRVALCASPAYLKAHGTPATLDALAEHNCLAYGAPAAWSFAGGRRVAVRGNLSIDNGDALRRAALAGLGIVYLPTYLLGEDVRAGRLVRLLPEIARGTGGAWAVYPSTRRPTGALRALVDFLVESFRPDPPWDVAIAAPRRSRS